MSFFGAFIYRQFIHYPPVPTASFKDKIVIVTGSNVGLGKEAVRRLVQLGASTVILACRNTEKGYAAARDIQATTSCSMDTLKVWHLDMSSYASVQSFADKVETSLPRLDALIANAGMGTRSWRVTEGNEETVTTNVISLTLLAFLLYPKLHKTALEYGIETHITVTASEMYEVAKFTEARAPEGQIFATLNDEKKANMSDRYRVTKLLEVFVIKQMAKLWPISSGKVIVNCVAPGLCQTDLFREVSGSWIARVLLKICGRPAEVGSRTLVYGASVGPESHGQYVPDCNITPTKGLSAGESGAQLQERVWKELKEILEFVQPSVTSSGPD